MPPFMCLLVGQSDEVVKCATVEADNTAEAMTQTELMLRSHAGLSAIEVWQGGRLAMKLRWSDLLSRASTSAALDSE
jgi:hypothetical protein